jgi:hypothetical protein
MSDQVTYMTNNDFILARNSGTPPVRLLFEKSNFLSSVRFWISGTIIPVSSLEDKSLVVIKDHNTHLKCKMLRNAELNKKLF